MNIEKKVMAIGIADELLPRFKGLSEKSASKMIKSIDELALELTKRFFDLQKKDCNYCCKMEKKLLKEENKLKKKAVKKAKIDRIIATSKPISLIALPQKTKKVQAKPRKPIKKTPII